VQRLRTAPYVTVTLREHEHANTVASWFQGSNPELGDVSSARKRRGESLVAAGSDALTAARSFVANG
jgi:hypothetical protein